MAHRRIGEGEKKMRTIDHSPGGKTNLGQLTSSGEGGEKGTPARGKVLDTPREENPRWLGERNTGKERGTVTQEYPGVAPKKGRRCGQRKRIEHDYMTVGGKKRTWHRHSQEERRTQPKGSASASPDFCAEQ